MKRNYFFIILIFVSAFFYPQSSGTINIENEIYTILDYAQLKGFCSRLPNVKPYSEKRILFAIDEILEYEDELSSSEIKYLENFKELCSRKNIAKPSLRFENKTEDFPLSLQFDYSLETALSGGLYTKSSFNQGGFDFMHSLIFSGDIGKNASYKMIWNIDFTQMPLYECGDYKIGYAWYDQNVKDYLNGKKIEVPKVRTIKKYINTSYLPYSYKKRWDGQIYLFSNLDASGTEGWADTAGISGGIEAEINASFLNEKINMCASRKKRGWAEMDSKSSLVLNSNARPFFAVEASAEIFPFLKYSSLTGILEYPNQDYINENSYPQKISRTDDSYFFQNAFSINMIEADFKYLYIDLGSSVIWPKRFEIGYIFPLVNYVVYQNHIGDYDNLALFGDIKIKKEGIGAVWASAFIDEINAFNNNPFTSSRAMYAGQFGIKAIIPKLPFASLSLRYTKVEPYCYTHHSINYTPWYSHYINENYTNNGYPIGYYLDPNSDETLFRFEMKPESNIFTAFQYQFIRHGADYGSQQVPGSSFYSELSPFNRNSIKKYFLHDGAYNWMHIISLNGAVELRKVKIPVCISCTAGFLYSHYSMISSEKISSPDENTNFFFKETSEYPVQCGGILSISVKLWNW